MNLLIILVAKYLLFLIILLAFLIVVKTKKSEQRYLAKLSLVAFPLSYIIAKIFAHFIYNPRPFVIEHIKPLFVHTVDNGFPSDHTLLAMTIAATIFIYNKKSGIVLGFLGLCVGLARVLAQVHHLTDIIGSTIIAVSAVYIAWKISEKVKWFRN